MSELNEYLPARSTTDPVNSRTTAITRGVSPVLFQKESVLVSSLSWSIEMSTFQANRLRKLCRTLVPILLNLLPYNLPFSSLLVVYLLQWLPV